MPNRRVLVIQNVPTPYRLPLFAEMDRQFAAAGIDMLVVFAATGYARRLWKLDTADAGFKFTVLESRSWMFGGNPEHTSFTYAGLARVLRAFNPDLVIVAGFSLATIRVRLWSWRRRRPYVIWSGSIPSGTRLASPPRRLLRGWLARGACAAIAYGSRSRDYLLSLGFPSDRVFVGINTTDTRFFAERTRELRAQADPSSVHVFTYVGYLSARKNVVRLLEAVQTLRVHRNDFVLDVVGDGDDRPGLEAFVKEHGLAGVVAFHGYKQRDELPGFFARSDAFLFQTDRDIWGLVLNEAMAAGVPCLASKNAGATADLVRHGETGFVVDFNDRADVCARLLWLMEHPVERAEMGKRASAFIARAASLTVSANGFARAVAACLDVPRQQSGARRPASGVNTR